MYLEDIILLEYIFLLRIYLRKLCVKPYGQLYKEEINKFSLKVVASSPGSRVLCYTKVKRARGPGNEAKKLA